MAPPERDRTPVSAVPRKGSLLAFLDELKSGANADPLAEEALTFLALVLTHPHPAPGLLPLKLALRRALPRVRSSPRAQAVNLREAAQWLDLQYPQSTHAKVLARLLFEYAVPLDDTPTERMRMIEVYMVAAGDKPVSVATVVPDFRDSGGANAFREDGPLFGAMRRHVRAIGQAALRQLVRTQPFATWTADDIDAALLALRMSYCVFGSGVGGQRYAPADLKADFWRCGQPVWNALRQARPTSAPNRGEHRFLADPVWHEAAQAQVLLSIDSKRAGVSTQTSTAQPAVLVPPGASSLIVCASRIVRSSDRVDKDEIDRHLILEQPLPLAGMPSPVQLEGIRQALLAEFPWAADVLEVIYGELVGRSTLGVRTLAMPATLFVGAPGSGKSRLARRIAEGFAVPRLDLPLGGTSDTKVLGGTSRGWGSARPGDLPTLMAQRRSASVIVLLDELDKAVDHLRQESGGLQAYLLALLEPETARRHTDVFLKTTCDLSGVLWLATANRTAPIAGALLSRLRVLLLRQPDREHYPNIAEGVIGDVARAWGIDRWALPTVSELELPLEQLTSTRQVRVAVESAITRWARRQRQH